MILWPLILAGILHERLIGLISLIGLTIFCLYEVILRCPKFEQIQLYSIQPKYCEPNETHESNETHQAEFELISFYPSGESKIVILDEATSSLTSSAENKMLDALNEHFKRSTVLSITHR